MSLSLPMVPNQIHTRNPTWILSHSLNREAQRLKWFAWGHTDNKQPLFLSCCWLLLALALASAALAPAPHTLSQPTLCEAQIYQTSKMTPRRLLYEEHGADPLVQLSGRPLTFLQGIKQRAAFLLPWNPGSGCQWGEGKWPSDQIEGHCWTSLFLRGLTL